MSKAFTKETDVEVESSPLSRLADLLPEGAKNYMTPDGARRMREELQELLSVESPKPKDGEETLSGNQEKRHRDLRVRELQENLRNVEVVAAPDGKAKVVQFGAFVTVRDSSGDEYAYRIVGIHETDLSRGWISWLSPIAKALLNARVGDKVQFHAPVGELELEIVKIEYLQD